MNFVFFTRFYPSCWFSTAFCGFAKEIETERVHGGFDFSCILLDRSGWYTH